MSDSKIYLKIPIGVIYYVCDPRTPRRNLYIIKNAEFISEQLWNRLLESMPEIAPLGGLHLYVHCQYAIPTNKSRVQYLHRVQATHQSLSDADRKRIGTYIGELKAEKENPGCTEIFPQFFFRCPHPDQAVFGFDTTQGLEQEHYGETIFLWGESQDFDGCNNEQNEDRIWNIIYHLYKAILYHWTREDIGITSASSLKYPGVADPRLRFDNFKRAVWNGEAMIQKTKYLNVITQEFGRCENDEFRFEKITDSEGKEIKLDKTSAGTIIPIGMYNQEPVCYEDDARFYSRICYFKDFGLTNALFRNDFIDYDYDNPDIYIGSQCIRRHNLFSHYFPDEKAQNEAIDFYLKIAFEQREEVGNQYDRLVERLKHPIEMQTCIGSPSPTETTFRPLVFFNEKLFNSDERKRELRDTLRTALGQDLTHKCEWYAVLRAAQCIDTERDRYGNKYNVLSAKTFDVDFFVDLDMLLPELKNNPDVFAIDDETAATSSDRFKKMRDAVSREKQRWKVKNQQGISEELKVQDWERTEYIPCKQEVIPGKRINNADEKYRIMVHIAKRTMTALTDLLRKLVNQS